MNIIYNIFSNEYLKGNVVPEKDSFKVALFTSNYVPSSIHRRYEEISAYETVDTKESLYVNNLTKGYKKGGKSIPLVKLGTDDDYIRYGSNANITWNSTSISCRYAIIYRVSDGLLVSCYDFGDRSCEDSTFTLSWESSYLLSLSLDTFDTDSVYKSVRRYIIEQSDRSITDENVNVPNTISSEALNPMGEDAIDIMFED